MYSLPCNFLKLRRYVGGERLARLVHRDGLLQVRGDGVRHALRVQLRRARQLAVRFQRLVLQGGVDVLLLDGLAPLGARARLNIRLYHVYVDLHFMLVNSDKRCCCN